MDPRAGIPPFGSVTPSDIARPAEFLLDRDGVVRWRNLSDNYKTRATPTIVLKALDELASSAGTEKK